MKIACYILSFYFIALTGIACADTVPINSEGQTVIVVDSNQNGHSQNHSDTNDGCSPLCVCHCCHMHFISTAGIAFTDFKKLPVLHQFFHQDFNSIEIFDFLKPPRT
ncbi:DUF6660 family protein [Echinicola marina]|uniref:DUF6660 family protein n=1 Tax=Echinicola marina TaxID=2859768 RepID=UPI00293D460B|nr:DUF6660 family protein [Echinicola marina]